MSRRASPATFHTVLDRVLHLKYWVIGATVALFVAALAGMQFVQQQFFPSSDRPELLVDLTLPQGSSINATRKVVDDLEKILKTDPDIEHWSFYVGSGAIRFYLPLDQQLANDFFAQGVIVTKGFKVRPAVHERILAALQRPEFEQVQPRVSPLELGPPVGWPLKFRISGPDPMKVREIAQNFASLLGKTPNARNINFDWNEPSKVVRVEVDQDRARALGISSQALSQTINAVLSGTTVTQVRDDIYLIDIVARAIPDERAKLETLRSLMINVSGGRSVPLEQVAKLSYGIEPPLVWRRHRLPTVTVQADTAPGLEAATVVKALSSDLAAFKSKLPAGYDVVAGGTVEESAKAEASIFAVFPLMILIMITILMVQLQSFQRLFLVLATAPLALIGVAAALLISRAPMGFVAILGVVSLIGMVIRNSVILIDQIDTEIAAGQHPWNAVIVATEHRLRPILLTAAAAILGMIPIAPTVFWGPMAYAVMGGLVVATLLTLVFLPALYVAWFRIKPISAPPTVPDAIPVLTQAESAGRGRPRRAAASLVTEERTRHGTTSPRCGRCHGRKATPRAGAAPFRMHRPAAAGRRRTRLLPGRRLCRAGGGRAAAGLGRWHLDRRDQRRADRGQCARAARRAAQDILGANHGRAARARRLARAACSAG